MTTDDIKNYLLTKVNINSRRNTHSALKLFFKFTLGIFLKYFSEFSSLQLQQFEALGA